jgi:glycosyltransferase involved in cell wall biosynthesis
VTTHLIGKLYKLGQDHRITLIHAHHPVSAALTAACCRQPLVRTLHGEVANEIAARRPWLGWLARKISGKTRTAALATPSAVIAALNPHAYWIPGGVDLEHFVPRKQGNKVETTKQTIRIGALARLAPERGLDLMIDAMALLARDNWPLQLAIAGDGPQRSILERRAARSSVPITFYGAVANPVDFLHHLDIYVSPAPLETFGLALLEAMASRLPIVAVESTGARMLLGGDPPSGLIVGYRTADLAAGIAHLLKSPKVANELANTAAIRAREYSWDAVASRYEQIYRLVLAGATPS